MYLAPYDFQIKYHIGNRNPTDVLLRRPDYGSNIQMNMKYLSFLQQKLAILKELKMILMINTKEIDKSN